MDMVPRRQLWVCGFAVALLLVSGLAAGATTGPSRGFQATVHLTEGRDTASFRLREQSGVILLYRIDAPAGAKVRASAQLPSVTVPLHISTSIADACTHARNRVVCTVGEEWCPMPEGVWQFRITKLSGPAGGVTLTFKVDQPPGATA
jgi:hypothetical protein